MSARIVITTFGSFGDVFPYVGLARGLMERGHRPVIATSSYYRGAIARAGVPFLPVRPDVDPGDGATVSRIMDPRRGTEFLIRRLLLPALHDALEDLRHATRGADLLLTHPLTFAGPLVAEERGLRWASSVLAPMSFFSEDDPPVFPVAPWLHALARRLPSMGRLLVRLARSATRQWTMPVRELRDELGLRPAGDAIFEGQHSPMLVLAMFSRLLGGPCPGWPTNTQITGQIFHDGSEGVETPAALERFLDAGEAPLVFALGSSAVHDAGTFYGESVGAARRLGRRAVLVTGSDPRNRPEVRGEDVFLIDRVPYSRVFPRSCAIVHQGGAGTLGQAMRAARPMLIVPHAHDQPDNAWRANRLGIAATIHPSRYRAERAAEALDALLGDPSVAHAAQRVGNYVLREDGVYAACEAVEELLGSEGRRAVGP
jgi:rhamnosyltransferase subunit B